MVTAQLIAATQGAPAEFCDALEAALKTGVEDESLNDLDDYLLELSKTEPGHVVTLAEIAAELYRKYDRTLMYAYTLNTLVSTLIDTHEARKLISYLRCAVAFVIDHDLFFPGKSIIANAEGAMREKILDRDEYLVVLREMIKFHTHFNQVPEATDMYCRAAMYLSQLGAFQSAYRILHDADEMVRESKSVYELPKVLAAHALVASDEADYLYAEEHLLKAIRLLHELEREVPEEYLVNLASMQMRLDKLEAAAATFEKILGDGSGKSDRKFAAATNLVVCKRKLKQPDALEAIDRARTFWTNEVTIEASTELELVACKTYLEAKLYDKARIALTTAVELLDQELLQINRLHYRRGFREPYVQRIVSMLCELPAQGTAEELLLPLAFVKSSSFSDWMCVLDWYEAAMANEGLAADQRTLLAANLQAVLELGAPVLYGFREKYEDPFESPETPQTESLRLPNLNSAWRNFNLTIREVCLSTSMSHPFSAATAKNIETLLQAQLDRQSCLLAILNTAGSCHLILVLGNEYERLSMPNEDFLNFYLSLIKYQEKEITLGELKSSLARATSRLSSTLANLFQSIQDNHAAGIVVLPDPISDMVPLVPAIVADPQMRDLLAEGNLQLRYCPVLHQGQEAKSGDFFFGLWDSSEQLPLAAEELETVVGLLNPSEYEFLDLRTLERGDSDEDRIVTQGRRCKYFHLASHGVPISNFTDPFFASVRTMDMSDSLSLQMIQRHYWTFPYSLAVLNACHSSVTTSHNYQKQFRTNEMINYATLLLLNRRSEVMAAQWTTFDVAAFFFIYVFYKHVRAGSSFTAAYGKALVEMYDSDKASVMGILTNIRDPKVRAEKVDMMGNSKALYPFRDEYCYGAYLIHSLL
jgi:hypothetical protein